nr:hypothetical protein [uncultured Undibacterium sp.]
MNTPTQKAAYINGVKTAENYIEDCVIRSVPEPDILFQILEKFSGKDEKSQFALRGFLSHIHSELKDAYKDYFVSCDNGN